MQLETAASKPADVGKGSEYAKPEVELFLAYLIFQFVFVQKKQEASKAQKWVQEYVGKAQAYNRRTLDLLTAKFFFWQAKLAEDGPHFANLRPSYTNALRTATVRQDVETQVALLLDLMTRIKCLLTALR